MDVDPGYARGENEYGLCVKQGEGVSPNSSKAARYFEMVVDYGNALLMQMEHCLCGCNRDGASSTNTNEN